MIHRALCCVMLLCTYSVTATPLFKDSGKLDYQALIQEHLYQANTTSSSNDTSVPDVRYVLFTRNNPTNYEVLNIFSKNDFANSFFDFNKETKILAFGWENNVDSDFPRTTTEAYLNTTDCNVIIVDWAPIAAWNYIEASRVVRLIGDALAETLTFLFEYGVDPEKVHLVGHSLGAHVVGIAGKNLPTLLPRVTGLDPAGPLFFLDSPYRISNDSARFVDIIHTCGYYLGFFDRVGHADFYPNKGEHAQPGCGWDLKGWCSHHRAFRFFVESIYKPGSFIGQKCDSWSDFTKTLCVNGQISEMGEHVSLNARGTFYLTTNSEAPYGKGSSL